MPKDKVTAADRERAEFSARLQASLKNANYAPDSPTQLAREFNLRNAGEPVTVHAVRKWLVGESIPTQDKLRLLADWLGVSIDWLRFGGSQDAPKTKKGNQASPGSSLSRTQMAIMQNLNLLEREQQELILKLVLNLSKAVRKTKKNSGSSAKQRSS